MKEFGGAWTEEKLQAFIKYVKAYLTILNSYKEAYNWKTLYFDGFSGSGDITTNKSLLENSFFSDEDKKELTTYTKGSVRRIFELEEPYKFDRYFFIDMDSENINSINKIVVDLKLDKNKIRTSSGDCNDALLKFSKYLKENKTRKALILLDPFGMPLDWKSIESLKDTSSDIWILVPSGVAINRLISKNIDSANFDKLSLFFGLSKDELIHNFYTESHQTSLFGDEQDLEKVPQTINKIVNIYVQQLKKVWKHTTEKPLILKNSKNSILFHFIFASNNSTAKKIASDIIGKGKK